MGVQTELAAWDVVLKITPSGSDGFLARIVVRSEHRILGEEIRFVPTKAACHELALKEVARLGASGYWTEDYTVE